MSKWVCGECGFEYEAVMDVKYVWHMCEANKKRQNRVLTRVEDDE